LLLMKSLSRGGAIGFGASGMTYGCFANAGVAKTERTSKEEKVKDHG